MTPLDILKTVAIAFVLAVMGVAGLVFLKPVDPVFKFASIIALAVVSTAASRVFCDSALNSDT